MGNLSTVMRARCKKDVPRIVCLKKKLLNWIINALYVIEEHNVRHSERSCEVDD